MSNTKHTPGPWTYKADDGTKQILIGEKFGQEACFCSVFPQPSLGVGIKTANANAKLIAVAPEMLHALNLLMVAETYDQINIAKQVAAKVIKKATE